MGSNYVEILVKTRDEAKPDLDDLRARLEELKHTVAEARAQVNTAEGAARLDALAAKLDKLDHRTANPKISMSGAIRAESEIHAVEASLDKLNDKAARTSSSFAGSAGIWAKIAVGLAPVTTGVLGLAGALGAATAGLGAFAVIAGPVIRNAVSATSSLVSANQAFDASAGLVRTAIRTNAADLKTYAGAMTGLAGPEQQVEKLLSVQGTRWADLTTAQRHAAVALAENKSALRAMLPDQAKALGQLVAQGQAYNALTPAQRAFATGLGSLNAAWQKMQSAITPSLLHIAGDAMRQLGPILRQVGSMAKAAAPGVGGLVHGLLALARQGLAVLAPAVRPGLEMVNALAKVLGGTLLGILRMLVQDLQATAGPLKSFFAGLGTALGALLTAIGTIAKAFAPVSNAVLSVVTGLLRAVAPVLVQVGNVIAQALNAIAPLFPPIARAVTIMAQAFGTVLASALRQMMPSLVQLSRDLAGLFVAVSPLIPSLARLSAAFVPLLLAVVPLLTPLIRLADLLVRFVTAGVIPAIGPVQRMTGVFRDIITIIVVMINWIGQLIGWCLDWITSMRNLAAVGRALWASMQATWSDIVSVVKTALRVIWASMTATWDDITGIVKTAGRAIWSSMQAAWQMTVSAVGTAVSSVLTEVRALPGQILHALGDLGSLLYGAGQALLQGLLSGIESMVGSVVRAAASVGSSILGSVKHALGIGSPSKAGIEIGANFGDSVIAGMRSRSGSVSAAASHLGRMAQPGRVPALAGAGHGSGPPGGTWRFEIVGGQSEFDRFMAHWIRNFVRVTAGGGPDSVQRAFGRVA